MNIVKDGHPFIFAFAIITFAVGYWGSLIWAVVPAVLMLFFIYFFRNPNRPTQSDDSIIYSPADGTVMAIEDFYDEEYLNEDAIKVTIFLSVFNVHVNRSVIHVGSLCRHIKNLPLLKMNVMLLEFKTIR